MSSEMPAQRVAPFTRAGNMESPTLANKAICGFHSSLQRRHSVSGWTQGGGGGALRDPEAGASKQSWRVASEVCRHNVGDGVGGAQRREDHAHKAAHTM